MYKLLIADDEPLVQVAIKSMCPWSELDIEICATAMNGSLALDLIEKHHPDIVISDIKMPVMDGLELLRTVNERYGNKKPEFIMLTSYEDFNFAKEAIKNSALDYLIKLELTPELLRTTLEKAIDHINSVRGPQKPGLVTSQGLHSFTDKFMICLLNNLFESEEQMLLQAKDIGVDLSYTDYMCCYGSFETNLSFGSDINKAISLYSSSLQMLCELLEKYCPCYPISLDLSHFALILHIGHSGELAAQSVRNILFKINTSLMNYYNISIRCGIGCMVENPLSICESYQQSRLAYRQTSEEVSVIYLDNSNTMPHNAFHFSLFRNDLTRAFEEYNSELLENTVSSICDLLSNHPGHYVQALDAASNILYFSISLITNGGQIIAEIFSGYPDGYMSLYHQSTVEQIVSWLMFFTNELTKYFNLKKKEYKNHIVAEVKAYISEHLREKLSLNEVAAKIGINPSYLSQLFSKYNDTGFSEYINTCKIEEAKKMLKEDNAKIYEVADALSFGSEFYFSKVFKKIEGISPTEYLSNLH